MNSDSWTSRRIVERFRAMDIVDALCVAVAVLLGVAWGYGIARGGLDYDELEHAQAAWLVAKGLRPYHDFFEDHPPFLWYPLSLGVRLLGNTYSLLFVYRILSAVGHAVFLVAIAKNLSLSFKRLPSPVVLSPRMFVLAASVMAADPPVLGYLLEFRLDAWPNALLLLAVHRYRAASGSGTGTGTGPDRRALLTQAATFGFLATVATLCSPKLMAFLAIFVIVSLAAADRRPLRLAGMAAGALACLAVAALVFLVARLSFADFYRLVYVYHQILNEKGGFDHGLARSVWGNPVPLAVLVASVIACFVLLRGRILSFPFELSAFGFLVTQLILASFPYKQYYAPWFLLGVAFIPYLELAAKRVPPFRSMLVAAAVIYCLNNGATALRAYQQSNAAASDVEFRRWVEALVPPDELVAASGEMMPVFRRSVFFHGTTSFAPSGHGTEAIMQDLGMGARFTEQFYKEELETKKPYLIIFDGWFTPMQRKAIEGYLARQGAAYRRIDSAHGPVFVRQP